MLLGAPLVVWRFAFSWRPPGAAPRLVALVFGFVWLAGCGRGGGARVLAGSTALVLWVGLSAVGSARFHTGPPPAATSALVGGGGLPRTSPLAVGPHRAGAMAAVARPPPVRARAQPGSGDRGWALFSSTQRRRGAGGADRDQSRPPGLESRSSLSCRAPTGGAPGLGPDSGHAHMGAKRAASCRQAGAIGGCDGASNRGAASTLAPARHEAQSPRARQTTASTPTPATQPPPTHPPTHTTPQHKNQTHRSTFCEIKFSTRFVCFSTDISESNNFISKFG